MGNSPEPFVGSSCTRMLVACMLPFFLPTPCLCTPDTKSSPPTLPQPVGATTPGSGLRMERKALKGVDSFGMLCSAYDIGWAAEADGVLAVLPDDAEVGAPCPPQPPKVGAASSRGGGLSGVGLALPAPAA